MAKRRARSSSTLKCGCVQQFGDGTAAIKLATNRPLVFIRDALSGWTKDDIWTWIKEGYLRWGDVCNLAPTRIMSDSDAKPSDIVHYITVANLGGGGVIADQMLPYNGGKQLVMRINSIVKFKPTDGPMQSGTVDPIRALGVHETGHFIGLQHFPTGDPREIMEPYIQQDIIQPQPTESAVARMWYGSPTTPPPVPPPTPGMLGTVTIDQARGLINAAGSWQFTRS